MTEYGKIPPQAVEAESAILGAMLLEKRAIKTCMDRFGANDVFYKEIHNLIYKAICELTNSGTHVDQITVTEKLKTNGNLEEIGGPYYLAILTDKVAGAGHIESHVEIILQKHILRNLIALSNKVTDKAFNEEPPIDLIDEITLNLGKLKAVATNIQDTGILSSVMELLTNIDDIRSGKKTVSGIPTMLTQLDRMCYGLQKKDLIIIAGRASMGKSALACSIAYNVLKQGIGVGIFTLEMSKEQFVNRLIILDSEVENNLMKRPDKLTDLEYDKITKSAEFISTLPVRIDDRSGIHVNDIYSTAIDMKEKFGVGLIIVDYLQLAKGDRNSGANRTEEIGSITRKLKQLAKDIDVPVIALSQINRSAEQQANKKPTLANLSESGSIENDADLVIMAYRPNYYGMNTYTDFSGQDIDTTDLAVLIIGKHRNGATGEVYCKFKKDLMKFQDINYGNPITEVNNFYERDVPINTNFYEESEAPF